MGGMSLLFQCNIFWLSVASNGLSKAALHIPTRSPSSVDCLLNTAFTTIPIPLSKAIHTLLLIKDSWSKNKWYQNVKRLSAQEDFIEFGRH